MHTLRYSESENEAEGANTDERKDESREAPGSPPGGCPEPPVIEKVCVPHQDKRVGRHRHLGLEERIEVESALRRGDRQSDIASRLGRATSSLSREIRLNGGRAHYRALPAQRASEHRAGAARRGHCAIAEHAPLQAALMAAMRRGHSPEEFAHRIRCEHPDDPAMHTSHESIYRYIYVVARGALKKELVRCLRRHHTKRKAHPRGTLATQGKLKDMVLLEHRPAEVQTRETPGHFEGDLIMGAGNASAVGVLVERTTRFTMLCHLPQKDATSVRLAFERKLADLPAQLRLTLTYDQGKEMAEHAQLAANLRMKVYFCHAHSPWERATCESNNDRIRHYLPKGMDLSTVSHQKLRAIQDMLNERPRKILDFDSPAERFLKLIISSNPSN